MEFNVKLSGEIENEFEVWINVERAREADGWDSVTTWRLALLQVTARWPGSQVQEGGHSPATAPTITTSSSSSRGEGGITAPSPAPCPHAGAASSHVASCFLITGNVNSTCLTCHFLASSRV